VQVADSAIVLGSRKFSETSSLVAVFFEHHGLYRGMMKYATSPKNRGVVIAGNKVKAIWNARLSEQLGTITMEIEKSSTAWVMHKPDALTAIASACAMVAYFLPERQAHSGLYHALQGFIDKACSDSPWLGSYANFEFILLGEIGFALDLSECAATGVTENLSYVSPKTGRAVCEEAGRPYHDKLFPLPKCALSGNIDSAPYIDIMKCLRITGFFLTRAEYELHSKSNLPKERDLLIRILENHE